MVGWEAVARQTSMRNERLRVERLVSLCQDSPSEYRQPAEGCVPNRTFTGQVSFLISTGLNRVLVISPCLIVPRTSWY